MITPLDFPKAPLKLKRKNNQLFVWCIIRKIELVLTPEEWVRQHAINYLIEDKKIPIGLIASEYPIVYNSRSKRADIVVFNRDKQPVIIVECKAPEVPLSQATMLQIAQYNSELDVPYLFLTNGLKHIVCKIDELSKEICLLDELPTINEIGLK